MLTRLQLQILNSRGILCHHIIIFRYWYSKIQFCSCSTRRKKY